MITEAKDYFDKVNGTKNKFEALQQRLSDAGTNELWETFSHNPTEFTNLMSNRANDRIQLKLLGNNLNDIYSAMNRRKLEDDEVILITSTTNLIDELANKYGIIITNVKEDLKNTLTPQWFSPIVDINILATNTIGSSPMFSALLSYIIKQNKQQDTHSYYAIQRGDIAKAIPGTITNTHIYKLWEELRANNRDMIRYSEWEDTRDWQGYKIRPTIEKTQPIIRLQPWIDGSIVYPESKWPGGRD